MTSQARNGVRAAMTQAIALRAACASVVPLMSVGAGSCKDERAHAMADAPCGILTASDGFKVLGIEASAVPAQVVDCHPLWDGADEKRVTDAVNAPATHHAVSVRASFASPFPATSRLFDALPESLFGEVRTKLSVHRESILSGVMPRVVRRYAAALSYLHFSAYVRGAK